MSNYSDKQQLLKFEECYKANLKKLKYYADTFINNSNETESIVHDCFCIIWENRNTLNFEKDI